MRISEVLNELAPAPPAMPADPAGQLPMDPMGGMGVSPMPPAGLAAPQATKPMNAHEKEHRKDLAKKDMPAVVALRQVQQRIKNGKMDPKVDINVVLDLIGNALRTDNYTADALRDLQGRSAAVKNVIQNIEPEEVTFKTGDATGPSNTSDLAPGPDPQQTVSAMANKAVKRRQK